MYVLYDRPQLECIPDKCVFSYNRWKTGRKHKHEKLYSHIPVETYQLLNAVWFCVCVCEMCVYLSYLEIVESTGGTRSLQIKGREGVVDGVAHGGLDGPAAQGAEGVVVGVVQGL